MASSADRKERLLISGNLIVVPCMLQRSETNEENRAGRPKKERKKEETEEPRGLLPRFEISVAFKLGAVPVLGCLCSGEFRVLSWYGMHRWFGVSTEGLI